MADKTDNSRKRLAATLSMIVAMVLISFSGVLLRLMDGADPWQINFYRAIAFTTAIWITLSVRQKGRIIPAFRDAGALGFAGGCLLAIAGIFYLQALTNTSIANTVFTLSAIPFFAAGLAFLFLRERIRRATLIAMIVAAAGIVTMVADGIGTGSHFGNLMALSAATAFAAYAVIVRGKRQTDMFPALIYAGLMVATISALVRWGELSVSAKDIILCFIWGGLLSGFANSMFILASRHLQAGEVSLLILLEFALAPIWVWLVVNETPSPLALAGGLLVMTAVIGKTLAEAGYFRRSVTS